MLDDEEDRAATACRCRAPGTGLEATDRARRERGAAALALALASALVPVHRRFRPRGRRGRRGARGGARRQSRRRAPARATEVEEVAWRWLAELIGFPAGGGHFTSGGTHANLTGLAAARGPRAARRARARRHARLGRGLRLRARAQLDRPRLRRARPRPPRPARHPLRRRAAHPPGRARARDRDRPRRGRHAGRGGRASPARRAPAPSIRSTRSPTSAPSTACGSTSTAPTARPQPRRRAPRRSSAGLELADSVAIDPHKWLYLPKPVGCVLVRDAGVLAEAFGDDAAYLENVGEGPFDMPGLAGLAGHRDHAQLPRARALDGVHGLRRRRHGGRDRERRAAGAAARRGGARGARPRAARRASALGRRLPPPPARRRRPRGARCPQPRAARRHAARRARAHVGHDDPRRLRAAAVHDAPPLDRCRRAGAGRGGPGARLRARCLVRCQGDRPLLAPTADGHLERRGTPRLLARGRDRGDGGLAASSASCPRAPSPPCASARTPTPRWSCARRRSRGAPTTT